MMVGVRAGSKRIRQRVIKRKSGFTRYIEHFRDDPRTAVCELTINHRGWISQHADDLIE